jgi:hypothetical protein
VSKGTEEQENGFNEMISPRYGFEKTTLSNQERRERMNKEI